MRVPLSLAGSRADKVVSNLLPHHSRSVLQRSLRRHGLVVDGRERKLSWIVQGGEELRWVVIQDPPCADEAQSIALDVIAQTRDYWIINKPAGMVVHPGAGHRDHTLLNALLHLDPAQHSLSRAGIVHRLDKGTSGLMVVARNEKARLNLMNQLAQRSIKRVYRALCNGKVITGSTVRTHLRRSSQNRKRMMNASCGKEAISHYRTLQLFRAHSLIEVRLETGRTHQIRSHMQYEGYPLVGDGDYGGRLLLPPHPHPALKRALIAFKRPALHAQRLSLADPSTGEWVHYEVQVPEDFGALLERMRLDNELDHA